MIGFESEETYVGRLRERLQAMDDEELIKFGKYARSSARIWASGDCRTRTRFSRMRRERSGDGGIRRASR